MRWSRRFFQIFMVVVPVLVGMSMSVAAEKTLYQKLGSKKRISKVVADFVNALDQDARLQSNPSILDYWKSLNLKKLKKQLADNVCASAGGPCKLGDLTQKGLAGKAPRPNAMEWLMIVDLLNQILKKNGVGEDEQREIVLMVLSEQQKSRSEK